MAASSVEYLPGRRVILTASCISGAYQPLRNTTNIDRKYNVVLFRTSGDFTSSIRSEILRVHLGNYLEAQLFPDDRS
jgi:hypothetical protein